MLESKIRFRLNHLACNRDLLLNLLRMSKDCNEVTAEQLSQCTKVPPHIVLRNLNEALEGSIEIMGDSIHIPKEKKMDVVTKAISLGIGLDEIIETLHWRDFENFCLMVFDCNNFHTFHNFHFSYNKKRYEIDIIGLQNPLLFAIDAKKWKTGHSGALKTMVTNQRDRAKAFAKALQNRTLRQKLNLNHWKQLTIIPMLVTSKFYEIKLFQRVPIVPFFKLNQFINDYPQYMPLITQISPRIPLQKTLF